MIQEIELQVQSRSSIFKIGRYYTTLIDLYDFTRNVAVRNIGSIVLTSGLPDDNIYYVDVQAAVSGSKFVDTYTVCGFHIDSIYGYMDYDYKGNIPSHFLSEQYFREIPKFWDHRILNQDLGEALTI